MLWSLGKMLLTPSLLLIIWFIMLWNHVGVRGSGCKYPELVLTRANIKQNKKTSTNQRTIKNTNKSGSNNKPYIVVLYIQGTCESCRNICRKHGVEMSFQRRQHHQGSPGTPQGQRYHPVR